MRMDNDPEGTKEINLLGTGHWKWNDETKTLEFISLLPPEKPVAKKRRPTDIHFKEILRKSEWLAEIYKVNTRGRQSNTKRLDPSFLKAYRETVLENQGTHVTLNDVKQVAVALLLENYTLPVPHCFLDLLKGEQLDEILMALLCYLCCFFEHKSLEGEPTELIILDPVVELQMKGRSSAKRDLALRRMAVCYVSLILDRDTGQKQHNGRIPDCDEWLLDGVLFCFFCYVSWVALGRTRLKETQDEIGRILYSDKFNTAVPLKDDPPSRRTSTVSCSSESKTEGQHEVAGCNGAPRLRSRPSLRDVVNEKSPLMVSLLPSPREQSPHLFLRHKAKPETLALSKPSRIQEEELIQELSNMSLGILGQPLKLFDPVTLTLRDLSSDKDRERASVREGQDRQL